MMGIGFKVVSMEEVHINGAMGNFTTESGVMIK